MIYSISMNVFQWYLEKRIRYLLLKYRMKHVPISLFEKPTNLHSVRKTIQVYYVMLTHKVYLFYHFTLFHYLLWKYLPRFPPFVYSIGGSQSFLILTQHVPTNNCFNYTSDCCVNFLKPVKKFSIFVSRLVFVVEWFTSCIVQTFSK